MENASKALIIAGAILIAILLISVGIMVMNSMNKPLDQASQEAASQAAQMYNSKFTGYAGTKKTAIEVKQLLTIVQANNGSDKKHIIHATYRNGNAGTEFITTRPRSTGYTTSYNKSIGDIIAAIENGKTYTIQILFANEEYTDNDLGTNYGIMVKSLYFGATEKGYVACVRILNDGLNTDY